MTAYVIAEVDITDPETYKGYQQAVPASVKKYGGRFLTRGGKVVPKDGGWEPKRVIVIEFPSLDDAQKWYHSPEYAPLLDIRLKATRSRLILVEGTY
ncbi:MAG: DUF1330 domain-containing protein [Betaproteobacteria bacterium]|nr:DUF1330 domain-containing protein [Betaproteobacteria bacterium]